MEKDTVFEKRWRENFDILCAFIEKYGRTPTAEERYEDFRIGHWFIRQRRALRADELSQEKIDLLLSVGADPDEDRRGSWGDRRWDESCAALERFVKEFGRLPSHKEVYDNVCVGQWLDVQKHLYRKGELPPHRWEPLNRLGVDFSTPWSRNFIALKAFIAEYGREPSWDECYDGLKVGDWLLRQRRLYKKGELSKEKEALLRNARIPLRKLKKTEHIEA